MSALNKDETEKLALAQRAMTDAATRLQRAVPSDDLALFEGKYVMIEKGEVEFMVKSLRDSEKLVSTVKQMKGYYPA